MFIFILNGTNEGKRIQLRPGKYSMGRSPKTRIILPDDKYISGNHAEITYSKSGKFFLKDLDSQNGTYLAIVVKIIFFLEKSNFLLTVWSVLTY